MDYAQILHISEGREQLDGKPPDKPILKSLVIIHFNELVQINAVQVEDTTQMISEHEVVPQLYHPFHIIWIALLQ